MIRSTLERMCGVLAEPQVQRMAGFGHRLRAVEDRHWARSCHSMASLNRDRFGLTGEPVARRVVTPPKCRRSRLAKKKMRRLGLTAL